MKIALINPPAEKGYIRSGRWTRKSRANQQWYPIWLSYAIALLELGGNHCLLLDCPAEKLSRQKTYTALQYYKPDLVAYYFGYDTLDSDIYFADALAEKGFNVVLVGPWGFCVPNLLSRTKHVQYMTYGEFDLTLLELTVSYRVGQIKGLMWKNHITGEIVVNEPRPLCTGEELDSIPFVTSVYRRHTNIKSYHQTSLRHPYVDLFTARSCPHRCTYCVWIRAMQNMDKHRYRKRSVNNVMEELKFIKKEIPIVKQIFFQDDTLPPPRAFELSTMILDEKLDICWGGYSRAEQSYDTLKLMKKSGCRTLHIGYEVPIQRYLDIIHKDITVETMEEFAKNIKKLGIWTSATFMIFPWMTKDEIKETVDWCKRIKPKRMNLIQAQAYPNTPYAKTVKEFGERYQLMSFEAMEEWEKWGFKQFYLSKEFFWECLKSPREWRNVINDARGLLGYLW